ncbi:MAG TPA: hypothetical protein DHW63_08430 [Hyphomonadaceae bacterium]|nr:hypothetical protein [Hyphomonadaceae bacterium]
MQQANLLHRVLHGSAYLVVLVWAGMLSFAASTGIPSAFVGVLTLAFWGVCVFWGISVNWALVFSRLGWIVALTCLPFCVSYLAPSKFAAASPGPMLRYQSELLTTGTLMVVGVFLTLTVYGLKAMYGVLRKAR